MMPGSHHLLQACWATFPMSIRHLQGPRISCSLGDWRDRLSCVTAATGAGGEHIRRILKSVNPWWLSWTPASDCNTSCWSCSACNSGEGSSTNQRSQPGIVSWFPKLVTRPAKAFSLRSGLQTLGIVYNKFFGDEGVCKQRETGIFSYGKDSGNLERIWSDNGLSLVLGVTHTHTPNAPLTQQTNEFRERSLLHLMETIAHKLLPLQVAMKWLSCCWGACLPPSKKLGNQHFGCCGSCLWKPCYCLQHLLSLTPCLLQNAHLVSWSRPIASQQGMALAVKIVFAPWNQHRKGLPAMKTKNQATGW